MKFIIENQSDLTGGAALSLVFEVVERGKISNHGKQYCYATVFSNAAVYSDITKTGTHKFTVRNKKS